MENDPPSPSSPVERIVTATVAAFTAALETEQASLRETQFSLELLLPQLDAMHRDVVERRVKLSRARSLMEAFLAAVSRH